MTKKKEDEGFNILEMFGASKPAIDSNVLNDNTSEEIPQNVPLVNDEAQQQQEPVVSDGIYKAFNSNKAQQPQLEIRLKGNRGKWLYYPFIVPAEYDGDESITLVYQGTTYIIRGVNLKPLRNHFRTQTIEYMQEFDTTQFAALPSSDKPFIEEIEIIEAGDGLQE